ncbi:MAG TPA: JAB domain-containing protein [Clostridia bacterium]|nr:JAB domain-containing protein [Clostridia bacterium]
MNIPEITVTYSLILAVALKTASISFMVCHNHPSSNLKPSEQDVHITERLRDAGKLLDLKLTDHLIISPVKGEYYSFSDEVIL